MIFYGTVHGFHIGQNQDFKTACTSDSSHACFARIQSAFAVLIKSEVDFLDAFFGHDLSFLTLPDY
jgi:hypothetical protein